MSCAWDGISYNNDLMSAKLKRNAHFAAFCLLLLFTVGNCFSFKEVRVTANTYTTNVVATYTIFYDRTTTNSFTTTAFLTTPLNTSSTVTLTFPLQYSLTSSITCNYQINSTGTYIATACNLLSNQITLTGIFTNGTILGTLTLLVGNVLNPYPAGKTSNFTGTIGADVAVANGVNSLVTITPATSFCSFTFSPNLVYSTQSMVFTLNLTNQFPVGGTIGVQFPLTRLWSQELDSTRLMPISSSMVCGSQSSNVNSAIQCTGSTSFAIVTFSNVVTSALTSGTSLSFSIANFIAPPSNQPSDAIVVTTYTGSSSIDTCNAYVTGLVPLTIPSSQFFITELNNQPMVVNQQYTIKFDITTLTVISLADSFVITFPSGTSINNFASATLGGTISFNQATSSFYNQVLTLALSGGPGTLQAGQIFITVSNFVAPPNTLATGDFQLQVMSNNIYPRMVSYKSIQAVTGALNGTVSMGANTVNLVSTYTFSITIADSITSGGFLVISFPTSLGISSSSTATITGSNMASSPSTLYTASSNSLTITNLNSTSSNIPAQTFTLVITGITNPPSTTTTGVFTITTYYNSSLSAAVDSGTISGVTAIPASIDFTKFVVSSSSSITSDTSVTYYFSFVVQNPIPVGGFVIIYFPTAIAFDLPTANNNCELRVNSGSATSTPCTASLGSSYIFNFTNPFPSTPAGVGTNITFSILSAATNPPTTQPVSPFSVFTHFSDGSSIANATNVYSFNGITTPSAFSTNLISKSSNKNGEYGSYTITLVQIANLEPNAVIRVVFPSSLQPQASSACSINYGGVTNVACGYTAGTNTFKVVSISSTITGGTSFSITFTNIRNAFSFAPVSGFTVTSKSYLDNYFYSSSASTNSVSNTIPTQFSSITYQYSPQQLSSAVSLQVTFQLSQYSLMPASLQISIDTYFTATNLSCSAFIDFTGTCTSLTANTIRVVGSFNNSVMGLTVTGFSSPNTPPSTVTYTTLNTFDPAGFKIDESSNNITFSLACTMPCRTCSSGNTSSCLSCYSSTAITPSIYFHSPTTRCYTTCPDTTYNNNATLICTPCDSNCLNCLNSPTFCTKCVPNSTYPFLNITAGSQFCVATCSLGMYGSTSIDPPTCVSCVSPCATCSSPIICQSCLPGYFFLNGTTCTTNCTPLVTIPNGATNICDPCNPICRSCQGNINNCTACNDPLVFNNGSCQSSCPSGGTLAPNNGICSPCVSTCQTCNGSIFNCASCNLSSINPFFVNGSCLTTCPTFFYNDSSTGSCLSCATSGQNCVNCLSATICISCDATFVLFQGKCINYVPVGYLNISGVAVACTGDCLTCSLTVSNCTSCRNLSLQGNNCVSNCSVGTISVLQKCVPCTSPCLTCVSSQTTCTACIPTLSPSMFLNGNACQLTCPSTFYANSVNYVCTPCTNNCSLCSSATTCQSCTNNTFLLETTCLVSCPSGYVGINAVCQNCTNNCRTCIGGTNICLTCVTGTYYINSTQSCVASCPTGLFLDSTSQSCVGCSPNCLTCAGSASICTACNVTLLFNGACLSTCPTGMYPQTGTCLNCPTNCSTCTAAANCTGCTGTNYLYNGECISTCPPTSARIVGGVCAPCSGQNCFSCTSTNVCLSCTSGFYFLNALCLNPCPSGYNDNGTHCLNILDQSLSAEAPNRSFPVPFSIAGVVLTIACLMSRLQFHQTYLSGAIYSLIGVLEWGALWYFLYLYYMEHFDEPVALYIGLGAMGYLYIMNITSLLAQSIFLCYQKDFISWTSESKCNKCFYVLSVFVSFIANHKFKNILFSKLFTFKVFAARLDRVENFRIFNIFSLLSLIHSGAAIFAAGIALTKTNTKQQLFHECIDVIVLTSLNVVLAFFNTHKDKDFFEETTAEGYSLHKKNSLMEEHLVGHKAHGIGEDGEVEQGYMNDYNHALTSKQAFKFAKEEDAVGAGYSDSSLADLSSDKQLSEKSYEEVSVQALDMLDTRTDKHNITAKTNVAPMPKPTYEEISIQADQLIHQQEQKGVDFSALPRQSFDEGSSFTTYFPRVDRSVQGNLDRGVNFATQAGAVLQDKSLQNDGRLGDAVDFSIQKSESIRKADQSMQYSRGQARDASFQYSRAQLDQSVNVSHHSRSFGVQNMRTISDKGVGNNVSLRSQGNQLSEISQEDEEIQMGPEAQEYGIQPSLQYEDVAIQPTVQYEDIAIQPDIDYEDVAIQPDLQYREISVQPSLQPSANQMAIQYEPMGLVHYDQLQQELQQSHTASNVLFETEQQQEHGQRQLVEEQVEQLQLRNEGMRSYQDDLEEKIRNQEKLLQEMRRKIEFKERVNAAKREQLAQSNIIQEEDINLQGITYVQQRPAVALPRRIPTRPAERLSSASSASQLVEEIQVKRDRILEIESKQIQRETVQQAQPQAPPQSQAQPPLNTSHSFASNPLNETLQEIKVFKQPAQVVIVNQPQQSFKKQPSERILTQQQPDRFAYRQPSERPNSNKQPSEASPSSMRKSQLPSNNQPSRQPINREPSEHAPSFRETERLSPSRSPSEKPYSVSRRENTIEEFKAEEMPVQEVGQKRQRTIEQIRLEEVRPSKAVVDAIETRSDYARVRPPLEKKQIEYKEYDNELLSEDSAEQQQNIFVPAAKPSPKPTPKQNSPAPKRQISRREQPVRNIQIRDMGNMQLQTGSQPDHDYQPSNQSDHSVSNHLEDRQQPQVGLPYQPRFQAEMREVEAFRDEEDERSFGNRQSEATRKNHYPSPKKNVVVDVTEVDQSLHGDEDYIQLEEASQSDHEPAGIITPYQAKPEPRHQRNHSRSDLSGTIQEIPQHQLPFDDQKTVSNEGPQRPVRPQVSQQQITNIFANSLPVNHVAKRHNMPVEEADHLRINKLYANQTPNQAPNNQIPRTARNEEVPRSNLQRKSTLAQAGRAQLAEESLARKKSTGKSPLKLAARQWEAQHQDKYMSEEEEFAPTSNRNNLVRRPANLQNFASHLVLPQQTDKQDTSFQHNPRRQIGTGRQDTSFQHQPRREAPLSGKVREPRQLEQIQVHFQADQPSRDLSITDKNRSPERPTAYGRQPSRPESSAVQEEDDVDYRQMMVLGQMQERPRNGDLQEYYKKQSKEKRRKSNSKLDRSTEKIYMQKLDKKR